MVATQVIINKVISTTLVTVGEEEVRPDVPVVIDNRPVEVGLDQTKATNSVEEGQLEPINETNDIVQQKDDGMTEQESQVPVCRSARNAQGVAPPERYIFKTKNKEITAKMEDIRRRLSLQPFRRKSYRSSMN
jgi:hypothetical protein